MAKPSPPPDDPLASLLAACPAELRDVAESVCNLLSKAFPDAVQSFDGENLGFGFSPGYKALVFVVTPQRSSINLGFFRAVDLPDPAGLLEGTGKLHRHVKLRSRDEASSRELRALVGAAMKARKP